MQGFLVIAFEIEDKRIQFLKHNTRIYNVRDRVEILKSNFLSTKSKIKADLVFLNPDFETETKDADESFCIFKHVSPNLTDSLKKAYEIASNIIILLPKYTAISEIAKLFATFMKECDM